MKHRRSQVVYWFGNKMYLNITNKCSNNCYFCLRRFWKGVGRFNLKLQYEPTVTEITSRIRDVLNRASWEEIVFCGFGEPTARLDCLTKVSKNISKYYGKPISLRVDTNGHGYLLNCGRDVVKELEEAGVNSLSISLNAHSKDIYNRICRPIFSDAFENVLKFIEKAKVSFNVEVTAVTVPEVDVGEIKRLAERMNVKYRIRRYIPFYL